MKTESEVRDYLVAIQSRLPAGARVVVFPDTPRQWCRIIGATLEQAQAAFESVELSDLPGGVWTFPLDTCVPAELPECNRAGLDRGLAEYAVHLAGTGPVTNHGHSILQSLERRFGRSAVEAAIEQDARFSRGCRRPYTIS